ncbi:MAG: DUF4397 domain-containing protein [Janthinobacterium lividum]
MIRSAYPFYKLSGLFILTALIVNLASCKTGETTDVPLGNAHLLLVNSAPNSSAINFYWTGNKFNSVPLVYGNTTGYQTLTSGIREVQVKANLTNKLLATSTIHVKQDSSYSFFIYEANNAISTVMSEDDLSLPSVGNAKIKLVNLSAGLSSADLIIANGPVLASSVSFGSIGTYAELKAGTYNFSLLVHGTTTTVLAIPNVRLDNGKIYTIWSGGAVNGSGTTALSTQIISQ